MDKIRTIIRKEWAEIFQNRIVLFTVLLLPLIFTVLPLAILYFTNGPEGEVGGALPPQYAEVCRGVGGTVCVQVFIIFQFVTLYMLLPLIIPATISAYSIVGEKTTRCLEPLLATPISTLQLLIGKGLAAVIPAIAATWGGFVVFALGAKLIASNPFVFERLIDPMWLLAVVVLGPLLAVGAVNVTIMVSSRVNDPRTAEQLSMVVIIPVMAAFLGQSAGVVLLDLRFMLAATLVTLLADAGLVYLGVRLFQRETILTRWK